MRRPAVRGPAARLVGAGTTNPTIEIRTPEGRWRTFTGIDDADEAVPVLMKSFEDLVTWARREALRELQRGGCPHGCRGKACPFFRRLKEVRR